MEISFDNILSFTQKTARDAGNLIADMRKNQSFASDFKDQKELVTTADIAADKLIIDAIKKEYPDHRILSEETFTDRSLVENLDDPLWIIDPIDGTVNYAHGQFMVAVSIAFAYQGEVKVGVVHNPFLNESYSAIEGKGANCNNEAISVSRPENLRQSLIATGFPYGKEEIPMLSKRLQLVMQHCADVRRLGSAAMDICWVACGRLDGYYESLSPWDFAAARLIASEAGAKCGHFTKVPEGIAPYIYHRDLIITTPNIYSELLGLLEQTTGE